MLYAVSTSGNIKDCLKLSDMPVRIKNHGFGFAGEHL